MKNKTMVAILLLLCSTVASAHDFEVGGIYYNITNSTAKTVEVTFKGNNCYSYDDYSGNVVIPQNVTYDGTNYSVTRIGDAAFHTCTGLSSITIPNSVTSIGSRTFRNCDGLANMIVEEGNKSYDSRESCNAIIETATNTLIAGCKNTIISNSVTTIGESAFYGCKDLTSVTIPNSVTSIGECAFYDCDGLTNVVIPNSVTTIERSAFNSCTNLTSVTIGNSVTSIEEAAFSYCGNLANVTIGNSVRSIGDFAFDNCSSLTSVTIPNSVASIGNYAFACCHSLANVSIGRGVTSIGNYAFRECLGITSLEIPSSVTKIGTSAFMDCDNLVDVYCLATTVPSTKSDAFKYSYPEYKTLHVPAEAVESYRTTAPWSTFGTIVALEGDETEEPVVLKCATPTLSYSGGTLSIACDTEGAEFITQITNSDIATHYTSCIELSVAYNISVYATKEGYDDSDTFTATLCWVDTNDGDISTGVNEIDSTPLLISSNNGTFTVSGAANDAVVSIFTASGILVGESTITNGVAVIATSIGKGEIAIISIAGKSVKVVAQ